MIFIIIYTICFLLLQLEQNQYDGVLKEKKKIEGALITAIQDAGNEYTAVMYEAEEKRKQTLEKVFLNSFYVAMGIFDDIEKQEMLRMYLPMLVLAEEDGVSFYYMEERKNNTMSGLWHTWSDKMPYGFQDESGISLKKYMVATTIEKAASDIISRHNYIASQYGLSYSFSVPVFLQNVEGELNFPMIFVVFQGWPLNASKDIVYENCIDAGAYLQRVKHYIVTYPEGLAHPFSLYHETTCSIISEGLYHIYNENVTQEEAIRKYGAFPCDNCIL